MLNGSTKLLRLSPMVQACIIQFILLIIQCESSEIYRSSSYSSKSTSSLSDGGNRITILEESSEGTGFGPKTKYTQIVETPRGTYVNSLPSLPSTDIFANNIRKNKKIRSTNQSIGRSLNKNYYLPYNTDLMLSEQYYKDSNPYARDIAKLLRIKQGHYADLYQQIDTPNRQQENPLKAMQETLSSIAQQIEREISNPSSLANQ